MKWYIWLIIGIVSFFIILILIGMILHHHIFKRSNKIIITYNDVKKSYLSKYFEKLNPGAEFIYGLSKEEIYIKSFDNKKLHGYFIDNNSDKCIILFHGYHSIGSFDFGLVCKIYYELGCKLLIVDERAHGKSEGCHSTFGILERYDVISWTNYIDKKYNGNIKIIIEGGSLGASVVMLASSLELPKSVKGIIADSGFTSAYDVVKYTIKNTYHLPTFPILNLINLGAKINTGHFLNELSTLEELKKCTLPICILHGTGDVIVPYQMSLQNYDVITSKKEIIIFDGAEHGMGFFADEERCKKILFEFFNDIFTK